MPASRYGETARNLGAAPNYNVLVDLARGRYFKWAAHDDLLVPTYLERCVTELDRHPDAAVCYPTTVMIDEQGNPRTDDPYDVGSLTSAAPHERFRLYMERAWPICGCNAVFGVIRTKMLKRTRLIGSYASSDKILLGELALLGPFLQLPESLFLRREHPRSSVRANPDITSRNAWFDTTPARSGTAEFIRWRWVGEYMRGIAHLPLGPAEQARSFLVLRHHIGKDRERLVAELKQPVKRLLIDLGLRRGTGG